MYTDTPRLMIIKINRMKTVGKILETILYFIGIAVSLIVAYEVWAFVMGIAAIVYLTDLWKKPSKCDKQPEQ